MNSPTTRHENRASSTLAVALAVSVAIACGGGGGNAGAPGNPEPMPTPVEVSTFDRVQDEVFSASCASESCHGAAGRAADLVLEEGVSYDQLVGVLPSHDGARELGLQRVTPGDPDASLLCNKIENGLAPELGSSMPYGGPALDAYTTGVIRAWIEAGAPRTGRVPGDDGGPLGTEDAGHSHLPPPERGLQLDVTAREVPPGTEETRCHTFKLPSDVDLQVNRFEVAVTGGSHHIHLYRPFDGSLDLPDESFDCNYTVDFDAWELVAAAQLAHTNWQLPEGVAFHFKAGEQLLMQTHFVNVGGLETRGKPRVLVNMHAVPDESVMAQAGSIFGQDRDVFVPANSVSTRGGECTFPRPITLMAATGHYHYRGRQFVAERLEDGSPAELLYGHEGYEEPAFVVYDEATAPRFSTDESLRWTCTYENRSDRDYEFGPFTHENEHCNLFAFYYPTMTRNESTTCVFEDGMSTTTVRGGTP